MGGLCSRSVANKSRPYANGHVNHYASGVGHQSHRLASTTQSTSTPPLVQESMEKPLREPVPFRGMGTSEYSSNPDDFYDGIPRFTRALSQKSRSIKSKQAAVAKVSEVSSRLGRAGTLGIGKAVEVLDTLGSSMTNLNPNSGFVAGVATKGNEISILAFEVANTIVKGSSLMQSLSKRSIRHLKEVVLPSEGVQILVSKDTDELLRIVASDKREELKTFSGEVVRFGNRSKDPQWHNLDRYFEKYSREFTPQKQLKGEAESVMQQLMTLVQYTAELYHEFHSLDRFEQDYQRKLQEEDSSTAAQKGDGLAILRAELKSQRKQVRNLKKKSLWSRSLEEVMGKLVDTVHFLHLEIHNAFGSSDGDIDKQVKRSLNNHQRLGPAGLSLHYANIVLQIDTLVARSSSMPPNTRDTLYQSLPPSIKSALRSKIHSFHVKEELTVPEIKAEMEKTLQWLVPIATSTAKDHHGFGWVGEWANTGSEQNRKPSGQTDVIRIETLHHADKEKTETYILELVLWLHHLVSRSKAGVNGGGVRSPIKSAICTPLQKTNQKPKDEAANTLFPALTVEDKEMLRNLSKKNRTSRISKSQDYDSVKTVLKKDYTLSKSTSYSPTRGNKELYPIKKLSSGIPVIDFGIDKEKALDVIDRVEILR